MTEWHERLPKIRLTMFEAAPIDDKEAQCVYVLEQIENTTAFHVGDVLSKGLVDRCIRDGVHVIIQRPERREGGA